MVFCSQFDTLSQSLFLSLRLFQYEYACRPFSYICWKQNSDIVGRVYLVDRDQTFDDNVRTSKSGADLKLWELF